MVEGTFLFSFSFYFEGNQFFLKDMKCDLVKDAELPSERKGDSSCSVILPLAITENFMWTGPKL